MNTYTHPKVPNDLSYEDARLLMVDPDTEVRKALAHHAQTPEEILYFLAEDKDAAVRRAIAFNDNTPRKADLILAKDNDPQVRHQLANKIGRILPDLPLQAKELVLSVTSDILTQLAQDEVEHVRSILADTIKEFPNVPKEVIKLLAKDSSLTVAEPVLQFSPVLADQDLLDIINTHPLKEVISAISKRDGVSEKISGAIVETGDVDAIFNLLENKTSNIDEDSMDKILEEAPKHVGWHDPLVQRPKLSAKTVTRLTDFVAMQLLHDLQERTDLDDDLLLQLTQSIENKIAQEAQQKANLPGEDWEEGSSIHDEIAALKASGNLNQDFIDDCLDNGHRDKLFSAIAMMSDVPLEIVSNTLTQPRPKRICALCYKAGISAHSARQIQVQIAKLPNSLIIMPDANGQYSMEKEELLEVLEELD
ncbi:DUF2336 domain-containing protein [Curvivirga aplysinae]|uniref:DUF2336 domain-containing protein n=1 Tax=Curvivirga aplysinae TaxID=2529852 RepID=UPI0012BC668A|nr:DUF2336 domain-containing protein [Curvivirga aplysinae]MTI11355.1 DUF2336 domain-containing protein [Curvivirga aplysinae]